MNRTYSPFMKSLIPFVTESNWIEGILRPPTWDEIDAHATFLEGGLTLDAVKTLQAVVAPGKPLRDTLGADVRVGRYIAPRGNPYMGERLSMVLAMDASPHAVHVAYEKLHPFMDGNGRTGRAVWLWLMMIRSPDTALSLPFLHRFYYQTLEAAQ